MSYTNFVSSNIEKLKSWNNVKLERLITTTFRKYLFSFNSISILHLIFLSLYQPDRPSMTEAFKQTIFRRRWGRYTFRKIRNVSADLTLVRHAKGGVRRDALCVSTNTSHLTSSFYSLALHSTSVFRLNALRVIKWFSPWTNEAIDRKRFLQDANVCVGTRFPSNSPTHFT